MQNTINWREIAERVLKERAPDRYSDLRASGKLEAYLKERAESAAVLYEETRKRIAGYRTGFDKEIAPRAAREIVTRDLLTPAP